MCRFSTIPRSFFPIPIVLCAFLIFNPCHKAQAQAEQLSQVRNLILQKKLSDALQIVEKQIETDPHSKDIDLFKFQRARLQYELGKHIESLQQLSDLNLDSSALSDYVGFYRGLNLRKLKELDKAEVEFKRTDLKESNLRLRTEVLINLGEVQLEKKNYKQAQISFSQVEKKARGTENYSDIIYNLARSEKGLKNYPRMCHWLRQLYAKFPGFESIKTWGYDLSSNSLENEPTKCKFDDSDFKARIRSLLWLGFDQKAQAEINDFKKRPGLPSTLIDQIQAQFYLQEGDAQKAFNLLRPHMKNLKSDFDFLLLFANAAARAGESQIAVGAYYSVFKLAPRSKKGRNALYQSAFLSYQFQDYDGANRRFLEFIKLNPTSGLAQDARWHLAWLKYLRSDYNGAFKALKEITAQKGRKKSRISSRDRSRYWMGMCLLKLEKKDQAQKYFEGLVKDPLHGYYSMVAKIRLKKMNENRPKRPSAPSEPVHIFNRFSVTEVMLPSIDEDSRYAGETEDTLVATSEDEESAELNEKTEDAADLPTATPEGQAVIPETSIQFKNAYLMRKFQTARDMVILGMPDWAKWDMYDIERRTRNKEHLKALMLEYSAVDYYHRSSYIAQVNFASARASYGLEGVRHLWEFAYPKAYLTYVEKGSKEFVVPKELIWGIMRAESSFRKDAISPVGALGLMQVMPITGHKVSQMLGDLQFKSSDLLQPVVAIRVGTRYLQRLMKKFDNSIPLVAASYNAGPHRVKSWIATFGYLDMDEFIEHIPFLETRNYVKKVVANSQIYSSLYNSKKEIVPYLADPLATRANEVVTTKETWDDI